MADARDIASVAGLGALIVGPAGAALGAAGSAAYKLTRARSLLETPQSVLPVLVGLERGVQRASDALGRMASGFVRPLERTLPRLAVAARDDSRPEDFAATVARVQAMSSLPTALDRIGSVVEPIQNAAPRVAAASAEGVARAQTFLEGKIPRPARSAGRPLPVPMSAQLEFLGYVDAVRRPLERLDEELRSNHLTTQTVETWQQVYPALLRELAVRVVELSLSAPLPYAQRRMFQALTGIPLDQSNEVAVTAKMAAEATTGAPPPPSDKPPELALQYATPTDVAAQRAAL